MRKFINAMLNAGYEARLSRNVCYLYISPDGYETSAEPREGWLYRVAPDGTWVYPEAGEKHAQELISRLMADCPVCETMGTVSHLGQPATCPLCDGRGEVTRQARQEYIDAIQVALWDTPNRCG